MAAASRIIRSSDRAATHALLLSFHRETSRPRILEIGRLVIDKKYILPGGETFAEQISNPVDDIYIGHSPMGICD